ncbi:hypothetical protein [Vibrio scophthalmi]|uniref:Uncharacterized protein n=1 Tax=Vibrio scophthalmi LMG 19158 TaxID=870967 RepID=F9RVZ4_9VIBR|nr:hypothetical protein [Vibrio scophthalmi]EGU29197.1 hypothetical protein VIS19158_03816 [Vibrio scophthalmi LMG 19158]
MMNFQIFHNRYHGEFFMTVGGMPKLKNGAHKKASDNRWLMKHKLAEL